MKGHTHEDRTRTQLRHTRTRRAHSQGTRGGSYIRTSRLFAVLYECTGCSTLMASKYALCHRTMHQLPPSPHHRTRYYAVWWFVTIPLQAGSHAHARAHHMRSPQGNAAIHTFRCQYRRVSGYVNKTATSHMRTPILPHCQLVFSSILLLLSSCFLHAVLCCVK